MVATTVLYRIICIVYVLSSFSKRDTHQNQDEDVQHPSLSAKLDGGNLFSSSLMTVLFCIRRRAGDVVHSDWFGTIICTGTV